ncbi:MAG: hypothetical protein WB791_10025 [Waddliaceae bacterium]
MKKIICTVMLSLLMLSFNPNGLKAACPHCHQNHNPSYSPGSGYTSWMGFAQYPNALDSVVKKLSSLPEGKELIERAMEQGPIAVRFQRGLSFPAFWETQQRIIIIDPDQNPTEGTRLTCLAFELNNALNDPYFQGLNERALAGSISKNQYVEGIERMEHQTGLKTQALLKKGVQQGLFPHDARQPTIENFEEHFRALQQTGHSRWIGDSYERMRRNESHCITDWRYHSS